MKKLLTKSLIFGLLSYNLAGNDVFKSFYDNSRFQIELNREDFGGKFENYSTKNNFKVETPEVKLYQENNKLEFGGKAKKLSEKVKYYDRQYGIMDRVKFDDKNGTEVYIFQSKKKVDLNFNPFPIGRDLILDANRKNKNFIRKLRQKLK